MKTGVVKFFNKEKGFGFIVEDGGKTSESDVFVHATGILTITGLTKGDRVQFNLFSGKKGIQAKDVTVIK